jgi:hypothetical protein
LNVPHDEGRDGSGLDRIVAAMLEGRSGTIAEQARFAASIVTSAAAPTNFLATNPASHV